MYTIVTMERERERRGKEGVKVAKRGRTRLVLVVMLRNV